MSFSNFVLASGVNGDIPSNIGAANEQPLQQQPLLNSEQINNGPQNPLVANLVSTLKSDIGNDKKSMLINIFVKQLFLNNLPINNIDTIANNLLESGINDNQKISLYSALINSAIVKNFPHVLNKIKPMERIIKDTKVHITGSFEKLLDRLGASYRIIVKNNIAEKDSINALGKLFSDIINKQELGNFRPAYINIVLDEIARENDIFKSADGIKALTDLLSSEERILYSYNKDDRWY